MGALLLLGAAVSLVPGALSSRDHPLAVPNLAMQALTLVAGLLLLRIPRHRRDGSWLVGAATASGFSFVTSVPFFEAPDSNSALDREERP